MCNIYSFISNIKVSSFDHSSISRIKTHTRDRWLNVAWTVTMKGHHNEISSRLLDLYNTRIQRRGRLKPYGHRWFSFWHLCWRNNGFEQWTTSARGYLTFVIQLRPLPSSFLSCCHLVFPCLRANSSWVPFRSSECLIRAPFSSSFPSCSREWPSY